jgi:hypothetical protein
MKIYESLYILDLYMKDIKYMIEYIIDFNFHNKSDKDWKSEKEKTLYKTLFFKVLLDACSYLQQFEKHFLKIEEPELTERIKVVEEITKVNKKEWLNLFSWHCSLPLLGMR